MLFGQDDLYITEFTDSTMFNFVGGAKLVNKKIRLTESLRSQSGGIWLKEKRNVAKDFTIQIGFQITDPSGTGADGIAFVIQNTSDTIIGEFGAGIGYAGIPNSIAVEFDTWYNSPGDDPDDNHIGIQTRGIKPNSSDHSQTLGITSKIPKLEDGKVHIMRIVYEKSIMKVFLDDSINPKITATINLDSLLSLDNGTAWLGFTSSTGGAWAAHDIVSFGHRNVNKIITNGLNPAGTICPNQVVTLSGYSSDTTTITGWKWILPNEIKTGQTIQYSNSIEGEYPIILLIERGKSIDTMKSIIKVYNPIQLAVNDTSICANSSVMVKAKSNVKNVPFTYSWKALNGGTFIGDSNTDSLQTNLLAPGVYLFEVYAQDAFGCDARDTVSIEVRPSINIVLHDSTKVCSKSDYETEIKISGGTPPYNIQWYVNNILDTTKLSKIRLLSIDTSLMLRCIVIDSKGCIQSKVQSIIVDGPKLSFDTLVEVCACVPTSIGGNASNRDMKYTYRWKVIDGIAESELSDTSSAITQCTTSRTRHYQLIATDTNGCTSMREVTVSVDSISIPIEVHLPSIHIHPLEKSAKIPITIQSIPDSLQCTAHKITFDIMFDSWVFDPNPTITKGIVVSNSISGRTRTLTITIDSLPILKIGDTLTCMVGSAIMGDPGLTDITFTNSYWNCSKWKSEPKNGSIIIDSLCKLSDGSIRLLDFSGIPYIHSIFPHPTYDNFDINVFRFHGEAVEIFLIDALGSIVDKRVWKSGLMTDTLNPEKNNYHYEGNWPAGSYRIVMKSIYGIDIEHCIIMK
jgi:hypothetical protein